jgi:hypothetical protein
MTTTAPYRRVAAGVAAIGVYLVVAWLLHLSGATPFRPLMDGLGPAPNYRWVTPPPDLGHPNEQPAAGGSLLPLSDIGSQGGSITTADGQASVIVAEGAFPAAEGQTGVEVQIVPLDPVTVGPAPSGYVFEGNAYTFTANYQPSGDEAEPEGGTMQVFLRYPAIGDTVMRWDGSRWEPHPTQVVPASSQVWIDTTQLGTFVAASTTFATGTPDGGSSGEGGSSLPTILLVVAGAGLVAAIVAFVLSMRERRRG